MRTHQKTKQNKTTKQVRYKKQISDRQWDFVSKIKKQEINKCTIGYVTDFQFLGNGAVY